MDEDHLDIYGNKANLIEAFEEFAERTREEGKILLKAGLKLERSEVPRRYECGFMAYKSRMPSNKR